MIRDPARKMNDFCVKNLSHSGAMTCNLCLELAYFSLQPHRTSFIQHFLSGSLTRIIHKYCRALACSFVRTESLIPQGILSCACAIHLIGRPYAWLRSLSSEWPLRGHAVRYEQSFCAIFTVIHE